MTRKPRPAIAGWIAVAFCALLTQVQIWTSIGSGSGPASPVFYSFLPMCFVFVAIDALALGRRVAELEAQVQALRQGSTSPPAQ